MLMPVTCRTELISEALRWRKGQCISVDGRDAAVVHRRPVYYASICGMVETALGIEARYFGDFLRIGTAASAVFYVSELRQLGERG